MNCKFCHKPCQLKPGDYNHPEVHHWQCFEHGLVDVDFIHHKKDKKIYTIELSFLHKGKLYCYQERHQHPYLGVVLAGAWFYSFERVQIDKEGQDHHWLSDTEPLIELPLENNITPENVENKLVTYLVFS